MGNNKSKKKSLKAGRLVEFRDPPARQSELEYHRIAAVLIDNPGRWGLIQELHAASAYAKVSKWKSGARTPRGLSDRADGAFEYRATAVGHARDKAGVYVRFIPKEG